MQTRELVVDEDCCAFSYGVVIIEIECRCGHDTDRDVACVVASCFGVEAL